MFLHTYIYFVTVVESPFEKVMLTNEEKEKKLNDMIILALESII